MFPTATPDANVIRYRVYFRAPSPRPANGPSADKDSIALTADHAFAMARRTAYDAFIKATLGEFIWHKHAMHLEIAPAASSTSSCRDTMLRGYFLQGETNVGDAIDDEWVVTWLLFQLTMASQFQEDDAIVTVNDTDGEFLLIECADVLPDWVTPENSEHRVFVYRGLLHLVSDQVVPETSGNGSTGRRTKRQQQEQQQRGIFTQAIRAVLDDRVDTRASVPMQRTIQQKLSEAPKYMRTNRHRVRCLVPVKVAALVATHPEIIGAAVEIFFYRDPREATALCNHMKVFPPAPQSVKRRLTLSRCQYAQLKQQQFFPPKPFRHWPNCSGSSDSSTTPVAVEIGMKLTCGLELLYAADEKDQFGVPWRTVIDAISVSSECDGDDCGDANDDDDDAWLYIHPDTLDQKLQQIATKPKPSSSEKEHRHGLPLSEKKDANINTDIGGAEELENIATMFNNFMSGISGLDGVEDSEPVQLDMSSFMDLLKNGQASDHGERDEYDADDADEWDDPEDSDDSGASSVDSDDELDGEPEEEEEDQEDRILREAMDEMDAELFQGSTLHKTFARVEQATPAGGASGGSHKEENDPDDESVDDKPLDLDFHLLSNLLESLASQEGMAGPVTNILSELSAGTSTFKR